VMPAARAAGITVHPNGTVIVIQGPRFSTRAESRWYRSQGFEVINMTQYPEAYLARELGICYAAIALITDYDTGVEGEGVEPVTQAEVFGFFKSNLDRVRALLFDVIAAVPAERTCPCGDAVGPLP
jgi:5'-methylthioadenosine phosphorylase